MKTVKRICCITSIISHYKVSIFYWEFISTFLRNCSSIWSNVVFLECKTILSIAWLNSSCLGFIITNISCIIYKFHSFSWKPNNSLNKRNILPRRDKYDYISSLRVQNLWEIFSTTIQSPGSKLEAILYPTTVYGVPTKSLTNKMIPNTKIRNTIRSKDSSQIFFTLVKKFVMRIMLW